MALNAQLVAELIRQRMGWENDAQAARVINLIPEALKQTGRQLAADPFTRQLVTTDRRTAIVSIGAGGKLDLTTGYDDYQFLLEYFDKGQVYFLPSSEIAGTPATGQLTVVPPSTTHAVGYLIVSNPSGYSTGSFTITQGVQAVGTFTVVTLPNNGDTIIVNGVTFTFVTTSTGLATQILIQPSHVSQAVVIKDTLNGYAALFPSSGVAAATYSNSSTVVNIQAVAYSTSGNSFTTVGNIRVTAQQATLAGGIDGVQSGDTLYVNGVECQWLARGSSQTTVFLGEPSSSASENASAMASALSSVPIGPVTAATYTSTGNVVNITSALPGAVGNTFSLLGNATITRSGATLTGGTGGIVQNETITFGDPAGVAFTFSNFNSGDTFLPFTTNDAVTSAAQIADKLNALTDPLISSATYSVSLPPNPTDDETLRAVKVTYDNTGTGGNSYLLGNSSGSGVTRSGATLTGGVGSGSIQVGDTLNVNGVVYTFIAGATSGTDIHIGASRAASAIQIAIALNNSTNPLNNVATYVADDVNVNITYDSYGPAGNDFALHDSSSYAVQASGSNLTGGTGGVNVEDGTLMIENFIDEFGNGDTVQFTTTDQIPTPLLEETNYYITNYVIDGNSATFQILENPDDTIPVVFTDPGSGIITVTKFYGNDNPMQMLANPQQMSLPQYLASEFIYFAIQDGLLTVLPINGAIPVGQLGFSVPFYPANLAALPASEEAERWFLQILTDMVSMPVMEANA